MYEKYIENADGTKTLVVQLSGSNVEQEPGSAIPAKGVLVGGSDGTNLVPLKVGADGALSADKGYKTRINSIVEAVGKENIKMFLTFSEADGNYKDLFDKNIVFSGRSSAANYPRYEGGPLGYYTKFEATDVMTQKGIQEKTAGIISPSYYPKYATRIKINEGVLSAVAIHAKRKGILTDATARLVLYTDNSGVPGSPLVSFNRISFDNRNDPAMPLKNMSTTASYVNLPLIDDYALLKNVNYWLVLEYANDTGVDVNNHLQWNYGADIGGMRAYWDGGAWTTVADESHNYKLYNDRLILDKDFTIYMLLQRFTPSTENVLMGINNESGRSFAVMDAQGTLYIVRTDDKKRELFAAKSVNMKSWGVLAITYSVEKSLNKIGVYYNGQLLNHSNYTEKQRPMSFGYGHSALKRGADWYIGYRKDFLNVTWGTPWNGNIGPILVCGEEHSQTKVAEVSSLMLGGGMYA